MTKKIGQIILIIAIAFGAGISGAYFFQTIYKQDSNKTTKSDFNQNLSKFSDYNLTKSSNDPLTYPSSFIKASELASPAVVFIKSIKEGSQRSYSYWDLFYNYFENPGPQTSSGSGVIISEDGYIVTNNHVIQDADRIEVVVSGKKKNYIAEVIGTTASSDVALLKIDAENLQYLEFGNSDDVNVGEWVIAIGNPFNLTSTVTSGIVSAKGRNINILQKNSFPIESFIQTDAAINPGNSGGALVNLEGKLIGINTAILSKTGSYAGYGFAIPANIVNKIIDDFKNYGIIQRAFMEAETTDIDEEIASKIGDEDVYGVYINKVIADGNADVAGIEKGDIIIKANEIKIENRAQFDEQLAYYRPGDKLNLEILRNSKILKKTITLTNIDGNKEIVKNTVVASKTLGASFQELSKVDKNYYGLDYGVKVTNIKNGLIKEMNLPSGFIILTLNDQKFDNAEDLVEALEKYKGRLYIKGVTPDGWIITRAFRVY